MEGSYLFHWPISLVYRKPRVDKEAIMKSVGEALASIGMKSMKI